MNVDGKGGGAGAPEMGEDSRLGWGDGSGKKSEVILVTGRGSLGQWKAATSFMEKKKNVVTKFLEISPCSFFQDSSICLQRLSGVSLKRSRCIYKFYQRVKLTQINFACSAHCVY